MPDISNFFAEGRRVFISGIGGVSTSALASLLRLRGVAVSGSDQNASARTARLESEGVTIYIGHAAANVDESECIIRSAAIHDDNPEIVAARAAGKPVYERADAWGAIMAEHERAICIAGTHGKTTTTGFAAQIALNAGLDPTVTVGGELPGMGAHRVGAPKLIVAEACEYTNSFLRFRPTTAVVLNIEEDHLDFFSGIDEIMESFEKFCRLVPPHGRIVLNADDPNTRLLGARLADHPAEKVWFSMTDPTCAVHAENVREVRGRFEFEMVMEGDTSGKDDEAAAGGGRQGEEHVSQGALGDHSVGQDAQTAPPSARERVTLRVIGRHNVCDALAAAAALRGLIPARLIAAALSEASGVARRFEFKGNALGADIYDDYAHHPSELAALFSAAFAALGRANVAETTTSPADDLAADAANTADPRAVSPERIASGASPDAATTAATPAARAALDTAPTADPTKPNAAGVADASDPIASHTAASSPRGQTCGGTAALRTTSEKRCGACDVRMQASSIASPTQQDAEQNSPNAQGRLYVVFHPHTYSRTKALRREFAAVLREPDATCLLPIYPAREPFDPTISSDLLAADCGAYAARDFADAARWVREKLRPGDILITAGAGEAFKVGDILLEK